MARLFSSYSHRDSTLRDELQAHLTPMQREGLIESWFDQQIDAGDDVHGVISQKIESADIILLLVSPYFLQSDYCYDIEMKRAMERHEEGTARVIPIILLPCDWQSAPFGKLKALPTDGKPITKYPNFHDGFLEVAQAIRRLVEASPRPAAQRVVSTESLPVAATRPHIRSSNLMVKKSFTDHDRDTFLDTAFDYIATFFEESLAELQRRNPEYSTRYRRVDGTRFTAYIYRNGAAVSECVVFLGGLFGKGIAYSMAANSTNGMNDQLSVTDDGTAMFLSSMGFGSGSGRSKPLSLEGGAEYFWAILMRPIQM